MDYCHDKYYLIFGALHHAIPAIRYRQDKARRGAVPGLVAKYKKYYSFLSAANFVVAEILYI